jgi:hypothetical protein
VHRDGNDLIFECDLPDYPNQRVAYRVETSPDDDPDLRTPIGWAGTLVANWKEALEPADTPPPSALDAHGLRRPRTN